MSLRSSSDNIVTQTGLADLRKGIARWKAKTSVRALVFGNISDDQWAQVTPSPRRTSHELPLASHLVSGHPP